MNDPFFRRIQVQNAVIKKLLSEIEQPNPDDDVSGPEDPDKKSLL
jgi:hypothetical protein